MKKIAFIGATGMIGQPVARKLVEAGFEVSALVRNIHKAKMLLPSSINFVQGDLNNERDLLQLMSGHDALYLNLNLKQEEKPNDFHSEEQGLQKIILVAQQSSIKRIAFLSSIVMNYQGMNGFNWWVFDVKRRAVDMIKASGIPSTIFYASTFMESLDGTYKQGNNLMLAGKSQQKLYFIAGDDYGRQVARSFHVLSNENREYYIQGSEAYTQEEAVRLFAAHYKKSKLKVRNAPMWLLKCMSYFSQKVNYGWHIIEALNKYPETFIAQQTWAELGRPKMTIKEYATMKSA
jgi:uncharacterized protein YbjT (DUF2867 family)